MEQVAWTISLMVNFIYKKVVSNYKAGDNFLLSI